MRAEQLLEAMSAVETSPLGEGLTALAKFVDQIEVMARDHLGDLGFEAPRLAAANDDPAQHHRLGCEVVEWISRLPEGSARVPALSLTAVLRVRAAFASYRREPSEVAGGEVVIATLALGFLLGGLFPHDPVVRASLHKQFGEMASEAGRESGRARAWWWPIAYASCRRRLDQGAGKEEVKRNCHSEMVRHIAANPTLANGRKFPGSPAGLRTFVDRVEAGTYTGS